MFEVDMDVLQFSHFADWLGMAIRKKSAQKNKNPPQGRVRSDGCPQSFLGLICLFGTATLVQVKQLLTILILGTRCQ
ncbi:MAG: hypothetical protein EB072_14445 [Betaproteobacteria bacterium]|nr:hypothetical protein [Betaproteobacteria bacterium]